MYKYKTLSFKIHVLKYVLKYKIQCTEHLADLTTSLLLYLDGDTLPNSHIEHLLHIGIYHKIFICILYFNIYFKPYI